MPRTDEIFAAADRQGLSLADYLKHNFSEERLEDLERNIRTQLNSLSADISGFTGIFDQVPQIERNLLGVEQSKLDLMQSRLIKSLHEKQAEFDEMLEESLVTSETGIDAICVPQTALFATE